MERGALLLLASLFFLRPAQGSPECREQAVSASGELELVPERIPQWWARVHWRMRASGRLWQLILTAERNKSAAFYRGPFSGRAAFQKDTLSLRISPISAADSGVYGAEIQDTSGFVSTTCFRVSVWEPVRPPRLEARVLHREPGRCNLSLLCSVPAAANVSYSWSCGEGPVRAVEHPLRLQLSIRGDVDSVICSCNASNPASWSAASTDAAATCAAADVLWSYCRVKGMLCLLLLPSLAAAVAVTHVLIRRRGSPSHHAAGSWGAG